jgi:hypothetical protein
MCGGVSLGETIWFGSLQFITDYFDSLSLSPKGSDSGAIFMGTTHNGSLSLWAMIEDSTEEFYMASNGERGSGLPFSQRHGIGAPPVLVATTPWLEDLLATQAKTTIPSWVLALWPDTSLPLERWHAFWEGKKRKPSDGEVTPSARRRNGEASSLACKQPPRPTRTSCHDTSPHSRWRRS